MNLEPWNGKLRCGRLSSAWKGACTRAVLRSLQMVCMNWCGFQLFMQFHDQIGLASKWKGAREPLRTTLTIRQGLAVMLHLCFGRSARARLVALKAKGCHSARAWLAHGKEFPLLTFGFQFQAKGSHSARAPVAVQGNGWSCCTRRACCSRHNNAWLSVSTCSIRSSAGSSSTLADAETRWPL